MTSYEEDAVILVDMFNTLIGRTRIRGGMALESVLRRVDPDKLGASDKHERDFVKAFQSFVREELDNPRG